MKYIDNQGERCLVFEDTAELFAAHHASLVVNKREHPVTRQLLDIMYAADKHCPFEAIAGIDADTSNSVLLALSKVAIDPMWGPQATMMINNIELPVLAAA